MTDRDDREPYDEHDGAEVKRLPMSRETVLRLESAQAVGEGIDAPVVGKPYDYERCRHRRAQLSVAERTLTCSDCGKTLDPFDWIDQIAREWDLYVSRWRQARARIRHLEEVVADLERKEKNAKARLRNAEHPALKDARRALADAVKVIEDVRESRALGGIEWNERLLDVWGRCRRAADQLRPIKVSDTAPGQQEIAG